MTQQNVQGLISSADDPVQGFQGLANARLSLLNGLNCLWDNYCAEVDV